MDQSRQDNSSANHTQVPLRSVPENPWDFFRYKYVISLEHRKDRRDHIAKELGRFPRLTYRLFDAIYPATSKWAVEYAVKTGIVRKESLSHLSQGQIGCILSHRMIWEDVLMRVQKNDTNGFWTLVMEDDIMFHPNFTEDDLRKILETIPADAKYIKFGTLAAGNYAQHIVDLPENPYWNRLDGMTFSTICYAIHSDYLPHYISNTFFCPLDWMYIDHTYGVKAIYRNSEYGLLLLKDKLPDGRIFVKEEYIGIVGSYDNISDVVSSGNKKLYLLNPSKAFSMNNDGSTPAEDIKMVVSDDINVMKANAILPETMNAKSQKDHIERKIVTI